MKRIHRVVRPLVLLCPPLAAFECFAEEYIEVRQANLVDVVAHPSAYVDQNLSVIGYLHEHVNLLLVPTKEHADSDAFWAALTVADYDNRDIAKSRCVRNEVEVTGLLMGYSGGDYVLVDVREIVLLSTGQACWTSAEVGDD